MDSSADPGHSPIRISDAASMLRRFVNPNERPYTVAMLKYNNSLVDEWHDKVLVKIADKDTMIRAGMVWGEWQFFHHGKTVPQFIKEYEAGHICRADKKTIDYWVNLFTKKSVDDLALMGQSSVGHGWKLIVDETFIRSSLDKWEKVYKGTNDPMVWRKRAHDNPKLWAADYDSPFWAVEELQDVTQKVMTVLKSSVSPSQ